MMKFLFCLVLAVSGFLAGPTTVSGATIWKSMKIILKDNHNKHIDTMKNWFIGKYDNFHQSSKDMKNNRPTGATGGHEYVYANIFPHPNEENVLVASYYFNKNETTPFRFRLYKFLEDSSRTYTCKMKLYKPTEQTNQKLETYNFDFTKLTPALSECEEIVGCDVGWKRCRHISNIFQVAYRGKLVTGVSSFPSQKYKDLILTVKDELYLWPNRLWINDRVYLPNGKMIIGNTRNIPYQLRKYRVR